MQPCDRELLMNIATILLPISGLFFWGRTEANADRRDLTQKLEANSKELRATLEANAEKMRNSLEDHRKETRASLEAHAKENREVINAIQNEMKHFHKQLCQVQPKKRRR